VEGDYLIPYRVKADSVVILRGTVDHATRLLPS